MIHHAYKIWPRMFSGPYGWCGSIDCEVNLRKEKTAQWIHIFYEFAIEYYPQYYTT